MANYNYTYSYSIYANFMLPAADVVLLSFIQVYLYSSMHMYAYCLSHFLLTRLLVRSAVSSFVHFFVCALLFSLPLAFSLSHSLTLFYLFCVFFFIFFLFFLYHSFYRVIDTYRLCLSVGNVSISHFQFYSHILWVFSYIIIKRIYDLTERLESYYEHTLHKHSAIFQQRKWSESSEAANTNTQTNAPNERQL